MRRVWVTRSQPGADKTAAALSLMGYDPFVYPLLAIQNTVPMPELPPKDAALIITSQNALRILSDATEMRHWRLFIVGDATANIAREYGFKDVVSAGGTSDDLVMLVKNTLPEQTGPLVHISGEIARGRICERLRAAGYDAKRYIYYASQPQDLPANIDVSHMDYVLLHSPLAAETFQGHSPDTGEAVIICISKQTQNALGPNISAVCRIAYEPNEASMFSLLD